ncbi:TRAP transporter substrate-binding protein DctP [Oceanobacillus longus]|uniref:TRAP transporter substrate-binding protein DctP n=1 Tax=Oceanobacillus longus TaxID=930120 RepID=A0ABV8GZZ6_9BACI
MKKSKPALFNMFVCLVPFLIMLVGCTNNTDGVETVADNEGDSEEVYNFELVAYMGFDNILTKDVVPMWIEKIEESTAGRVQIEWVGGHEVIPREEQFDAVSNGIVDVSFNASAFFSHIMPEADTLHLSPYTPHEERENGYFNYLSEKFENHNLKYLGRYISGMGFYLWSNEKIETLEDLKGLSFRTSPVYQDILDRLGVNPVSIPPAEIYTAIDRNMVDGYGYPILGPYEDGLTEVTNYIINEPFLNNNNAIFFNMDVFQTLPSELQETLLKATEEFEYDMLVHFEKESERQWENSLKHVEIIDLGDEDSERFQEVVNDVYWEKFESDIPDEVDVIKELFDITN